MSYYRDYYDRDYYDRHHRHGRHHRRHHDWYDFDYYGSCCAPRTYSCYGYRSRYYDYY